MSVSVPPLPRATFPQGDVELLYLDVELATRVCAALGCMDSFDDLTLTHLSKAFDTLRQALGMVAAAIGIERMHEDEDRQAIHHLLYGGSHS